MAEATLDEVRCPSQTPFPIAQTTTESEAAIAFTSGSTGVPKGVVYQHRNFVAQVEKIREHYSIEPGEIDLPTFPLFALFDPALGMTTVVPLMDPTRPAEADPVKLVDAIERFKVTNIFGSPALLDTLSRHCVEHNIRLESVTRVISAGAAVPTNLDEMLEAARRTARASAENGPVRLTVEVVPAVARLSAVFRRRATFWISEAAPTA